MNPRPTAYKYSTIDWEKFNKLILQKYRKKYARDIIKYAKKFSYCLLKQNLTDLQLMGDGKRRNTMKALSALAKFLGVYENLKRMIKNYGLKWNGKNNDDLIIDRLTKTGNPNQVFEWIKKVKNTFNEFKDFLDFIAITGLRFNETIESYNLIIKLSKEERLKEYYDFKRELLEHYRFKTIFLRRTKKAFISFVPLKTVKKIASNTPLTSDIIYGKLKRKKIIFKFSEIRELHGTLLTKYLRQPEIDFLHGRVSTNVFMRNYFNPTWIKDLKARVFKSIKEITKAIYH